MKGVKIIGLTTARDEEDIIYEALNHVAPLVDCCVIVDCGSSDNTADEIRRAITKHNNLVFAGAIGPHYAEQVRRHVYKACKSACDKRTWWMIADADEFADEALRNVVEEAQREGADHVLSEHANFYYTRDEAEAWFSGAETLADRKRPISERRRFYLMELSLKRLFRHLPRLRWNRDTSFPENLAIAAKRRVIFRHYQYRDVDQIKRRIKIRSSLQSESDLMRANPHWKTTNFEEKIMRKEELKMWQAGEPLIRCSSLPPSLAQPIWKSTLKSLRAQFYAWATPDLPPEMFHDSDLLERVSACLSRT